MSLNALYFDAERNPSRDDLDAIIGSRLRELRRGCGFSQAHLADRLGITVFELGRLERGFTRISAVRLIELSMVLNISPVEFWATL